MGDNKGESTVGTCGRIMLRGSAGNHQSMMATPFRISMMIWAAVSVVSSAATAAAKAPHIVPVEILRNTFFRSNALALAHSYGPDPHSRC